MVSNCICVEVYILVCIKCGSMKCVGGGSVIVVSCG